MTAGKLARTHTPPEPALTDVQRTKFLAALKADPCLGNVAALKAAGVKGTKRDLRALVDGDLEEDARLARGWNLRAVENTIWGVAVDREHPSWQRTAQMVMRAYGGDRWQDKSKVEHTGEVDVPDLSAALERFNDLAASAVGAASRAGARELPPGANTGGES